MLVEYPYSTPIGPLNMILSASQKPVKENPERIKLVVDMHKKAVDYAMAHQPEIVDMAMQKLGQQKKSVELAVPNVELAWKIDDVFMERAKAYTQLMYENKQTPPDDRPGQVRHHAVPVAALPIEDRLERARHGASGSDTAGRTGSADGGRTPSARAGSRKLAAIALGAGFPDAARAAAGTSRSPITGTRLIPSPRQVAVMMYDFSFGGIYDDAFSATILTHIWKSMTRVYGGFFLAAIIGIPLGLMIGRMKMLRQLLDPTINLLRPIPVTAWLPLSMIFFGLGPNAAIFLVFLGAFYPILLNTTFGVRSVDPRLFEAAVDARLLRARRCSGRSCFRPRCRRSSTGCASRTASPGS